MDDEDRADLAETVAADALELHVFARGAEFLDRALQRREEPAGAFDLASAAAAERNHRAGRLAARGGLLAETRQVGGRVQQPFRRDDHGFSFAPYSARISGTCAGVTLP